MNFVDTTFFDPETGLRETIVIGPHPLRRQLSDAGSLDPALALPGFCHILRP